MKVKKCINLGTNKNEGQQVTTVLINGEMGGFKPITSYD